jgi:hypothetical protein
MQLFKRAKFITFTSVGIMFDIISAIFLGYLYSPTLSNPGATYGKYHYALSNPNNFALKFGFTLFILSFIAILTDHLLDIYNPRKKWIQKLFHIILSVYLGLLILLLLFCLLIIVVFVKM